MTESPIKVYPAKLPYRKWQGGSVSEPTQFKGLRTIDKPEQPKSIKELAEDFCNHPTEQLNQNQIIIKKIQCLMSKASKNLDKLDKNIQFLSCRKPLLVRQAHKDISKLIEDVDMFEKTTLFDLQKAFE